MIYPIYRNTTSEQETHDGMPTGLRTVDGVDVVAFTDSSEVASREVRRLNRERTPDEIDNGIRYVFGHGRKDVVYFHGRFRIVG